MVGFCRGVTRRPSSLPAAERFQGRWFLVKSPECRREHREQGQGWEWVVCVFITCSGWMTRGPEPLDLSSRHKGGNVTLPSITKTPPYPTSMCLHPLNSGSQRCRTGLARCPDLQAIPASTVWLQPGVSSAQTVQRRAWLWLVDLYSARPANSSLCPAPSLVTRGPRTEALGAHLSPRIYSSALPSSSCSCQISPHPSPLPPSVR